MIHIPAETSSLKVAPHWSENTPSTSCQPSHNALCLCYFVVFLGYCGFADFTMFTETAGCACARSARGWGTGMEKPEFSLKFCSSLDGNTEGYPESNH